MSRSTTIERTDGLSVPNSEINVSQPERLISILLGGALAAYAASRVRWGNVLLAVAGGGLVYRGVTGHCDLYGLLGIDTTDADSLPKAPSRSRRT